MSKSKIKVDSFYKRQVNDDAIEYYGKAHR